MGRRTKRTKTTEVQEEVQVVEEIVEQVEEVQVVAKEESLRQPEQEEAQLFVKEESLEQPETGNEEDNEVFEEKRQTQSEQGEEKPKGEAYVSVEKHVDTIKEALKARPVNGLVVASKHYGFLNSVRNVLGKPNGITMLDLDKMYEDNQEAFGIDVVMIGALDWKWGDESKNAYTSLLTVLLLRKDGGAIYKKNVQAEFKGQYQELGSVLISLI